jgi:hypothetical protein
MSFEEQQRMPAEAGGMRDDRSGRAAQEAVDLPETRSGQQALTDGVEQLGAAQPVAGLEGLSAEGAAAV